MALLAEVRDTIGKVSGKVGPSLVGIGQRWGIGSGVVIGPGRILTNAHNVRGDEVSVTFQDGRVDTGRVAGIDADGDLAVISVDTKDAPAIAWSDAHVAAGTPVLALANPGGRGLRVTVGLVSGVERSFRGPRGRRITGSIEHTAPLLPGSSGGPVVDEDGSLLGLNTNRLGEGFYLAIPADEALRGRVDALGRGEAPKRVRLGVGIAPAHVARRLRRAVGLPEADGLLVRGVEDGSAAERAGLKEGDLIVSAGGRDLKTADDLFAALEGVKEGSSLELKVLRGAEELTISVGFGD